MSRRAHLHRLAIGSLTAAGALLLLAAAPVGGSVGATTTPDDAVATTTDPADGSADSADGASATGPEGSAAPPGTAPDRATFERQMDMMLGLVPQDEMEAFYDQQNVEYQRRIADCMIEAGFEYNPENSGGVSFETGGVEWAEQWGFGMFTSMDPEDNPWSGEEFEWHDPNGEYLESLSEAQQTAFWAQQNRCYENVEWDDGSSAIWSNSDFQRVMQDFWADIENDPKTVAAERAWAGCMDEAGHPFSTVNEVYEEWFSQSQNEKQMRFWESEAWLATSPDHDEWQRLVDEEISVAVALETCSAPLNETREEIMRAKRSDLLELYQTIDWSAPPVTYPEFEYFDEWNFDGTIVVDGADDPGEGSTPNASPSTTRPRLDLSGAGGDD